MEYEEEGYGSGGLTPCPICGRSFNPDSLSRHEPICKKSALKAKKRKVFDSGKQRATGTDIPIKATIRPGQIGKEAAPRSGNKPQPASKNNWRQQHQEFIAAIRNARGVDQALKAGGPLPPPPAPSLNPDYVTCRYCQRRFNENAHGRHEPFCKEKHGRISSKPVISDQAKQRAAARTVYKAPRLKQKTESDMANGGDYGGYGGGGYGSSMNYGSPGTGSRPPPGGGRAGAAKSASSRGSARSGTTYSSARRDSGGSFNGGYGNMTKSESMPQASDQGMGRPMRTGRDPQTYQDAKNSVRGTGMARSNMSRYSNSMESLTHLSPAVSPSDFDSRTSPSRYRGTPPGSGRGMTSNASAGRQGNAVGKFCHECGTKYPIATAKFCGECGIKRMALG
ncbi:zinc finger C2HC domain-containing protein 1A-like isoform X2 [Lineus longissimus]|uniref:zinc finger C2HC domain-containing protein 1A-like isoform X2 n=1 Tax=Lineus longissimus TaxID=88925 RepID=UPI00315CEE64